MSDGHATGAERPTEFKSALEKLQTLFAGVLWDAKVNSCATAWSDIRRAKSAKKKIEIFNEQAHQWREGSVKAIREWLPKFVDLADAYPDAIECDTLHWAKERGWDGVEAQCEIPRPKSGEPLRNDRITRTMVYWFAVASEGNFGVNLPPLRPWRAPRWLARDSRETDSLLRDHAMKLWLRLNHVIDEELDLAQIQGAIRSRAGKILRTAAKKESNCYFKNGSSQTLVFRGSEYSLTPQAGAIVKTLLEANGAPVAKADIQSKTKCARVRDSFRSPDGRRVWRELIQVTKGRKGFYRLHPDAFRHSQ